MDKLTVYEWCDGEWCFLEDLEERLSSKSDDFEEVEFDRKKHVIVVY
jgi:hypothetical protein